ncbi:nuclease-related domain-containing protein [Peribacillus acanthi]|uniref:nuclease-related domain-containing protein n=1 Tax=Peribacillus acanthi TaxID=2171554 RepID=UPI001300B440|nr:nuclease-related domain-containing protein [Peribacillus acanthi]
MIIKPRCMSKELKIWRAVTSRMNLSVKEITYYSNLEKGFKGEKKFDVWLLSNFPNDGLVLNDLLLEYNNTVFQIDTLLLSSEKIFLFEIKNYEGDYIYDKDRWYTKTKNEIKNPFLQLQRSELLFRQLIQEHRMNLSIEPHLIFINPEFHLYKAPTDLPIIFPTQLNRFKNYLNSSNFTIEDKHSNLANLLVSLHLKESPYTRLPKYNYNHLSKGIICNDCFTITEVKERKVVCNNCGYIEALSTAIFRSVKEFKLLFPERKVTTGSISEWCRSVKSRKIIRLVLSRNYSLKGHGKSACYVDK